MTQRETLAALVRPVTITGTAAWSTRRRREPSGGQRVKPCRSSTSFSALRVTRRPPDGVGHLCRKLCLRPTLDRTDHDRMHHAAASAAGHDGAGRERVSDRDGHHRTRLDGARRTRPGNAGDRHPTTNRDPNHESRP
jgi:hypothetical protein